MALTYLPITSEKGMKFFSSNHKGNIAKAYIAHSPDLEKANNTLWRRGYPLQLRKRILDTYRAYVNDPTMANVPFSPQPLWDWKEELLHSEHKTLEEIIYGRSTTPVVPKLEWVITPPDTLATNTNFKATWKGGTAPYKTDIIGPVNLNPTDVTAPPLELVMNVDGTSQPVGSYVWTIESHDGQKITHTTVVS